MSDLSSTDTDWDQEVDSLLRGQTMRNAQFVLMDMLRRENNDQPSFRRASAYNERLEALEYLFLQQNPTSTFKEFLEENGYSSVLDLFSLTSSSKTPDIGDLRTAAQTTFKSRAEKEDRLFNSRVERLLAQINIPHGDTTHTPTPQELAETAQSLRVGDLRLPEDYRTQIPFHEVSLFSHFGTANPRAILETPPALAEAYEALNLASYAYRMEEAAASGRRPRWYPSSFDFRQIGEEDRTSGIAEFLAEKGVIRHSYPQNFVVRLAELHAKAFAHPRSIEPPEGLTPDDKATLRLIASALTVYASRQFRAAGYPANADYTRQIAAHLGGGEPVYALPDETPSVAQRAMSRLRQGGPQLAQWAAGAQAMAGRQLARLRPGSTPGTTATDGGDPATTRAGSLLRRVTGHPSVRALADVSRDIRSRGILPVLQEGSQRIAERRGELAPSPGLAGDHGGQSLGDTGSEAGTGHRPITARRGALLAPADERPDADDGLSSQPVILPLAEAREPADRGLGTQRAQTGGEPFLEPVKAESGPAAATRATRAPGAILDHAETRTATRDGAGDGDGEGRGGSRELDHLLPPDGRDDSGTGRGERPPVLPVAAETGLGEAGVSHGGPGRPSWWRSRNTVADAKEHISNYSLNFKGFLERFKTIHDSALLTPRGISDAKQILQDTTSNNSIGNLARHIRQKNPQVLEALGLNAAQVDMLERSGFTGDRLSGLLFLVQDETTPPTVEATLRELNAEAEQRASATKAPVDGRATAARTGGDASDGTAAVDADNGGAAPRPAAGDGTGVGDGTGGGDRDDAAPLPLLPARHTDPADPGERIVVRPRGDARDDEPPPDWLQQLLREWQGYQGAPTNPGITNVAIQNADNPATAHVAVTVGAGAAARTVRDFGTHMTTDTIASGTPADYAAAAKAMAYKVLNNPRYADGCVVDGPPEFKQAIQAQMAALTGLEIRDEEEKDASGRPTGKIIFRRPRGWTPVRTARTGAPLHRAAHAPAA